MKMQKAIKKVVALGAGATMLGATLMGALAANDLASYPEPFVKDGKFNAFIVVGDKAAAEDVIGAVDVAAALQYSMKKEVVTAGTATTSVEGGAKVETSASKLYYGARLNDVKGVITSTELPVLLKTGKVTDSEGTTYDVRTQVAVPNSTVLYGKSGAAGDESEPVLYMDMQTSTPTYTIQIDFPTSANLTLANGKIITLFGKEYTLGSTSEVTSTKVTLYTAAVDQSFTAGQSATVSVGGSDVTVEVIGVNTQASTATATVKVNGESATVSAGNTYTIGSQKVYVKDIFAYTQPVGGGGVRLFIGSQKMVLEHGNPVTAGAAGTSTIDGTLVSVVSAGGKISRIAINVTPYNVAPYPKLLKSGGSFADPVFKAFKWVFGGATPAVDSADKTPIKIYPSGENGLKLDFVNKNGQKYSLNVVKGYSAASGAFDQNDIMVGVGDYQLVLSNNLNINKSDYFVLSTGEYQRILRLSSFVNSSNNQYVTVKDVSDGGAENQWTFSGTPGSGTMIYDGTSYTFNVIVRGTSDGSINFTSGVANTLYTNADMLITLPTQNSTGDGLAPAYINITERTSYSGGTVNDHGIVQVNFTYSYGRNGNDLQLGTPIYTRLAGTTSSVSFALVGSSGYDNRALTPFGTLLKWNSDTALTRFEAWTYPIETTFDVFLAPTAAVTSVSGGGKTVTIEQIQVGSAKLASEIADVAAQNLILVGGPCANAAASKVMSNPADCTAGFKDGEAMVKLYDTGKGNWALLIAGSSAIDTRRASKAVASGKLSTVAAGVKEAKVTTVTDTPTITVVTP